MDKITAFIRLSRPHTIIATTLQVTGLFILAGGTSPLDTDGLVVLTLALIASLSSNVYIVGLNQLTDVEIDRINKPYLPLASGEFTIRQGRWIVASLGLVAVVLAATQGPILLLTVGISVIVGTAYSLPPPHLKSRPLWAALSIAVVRGLVANIGLYTHFHQKLQPESVIPWPLVIGLSIFFFGFGLAIALFKDIPDHFGDRQYGIRTFTVRLGPRKVFNIGRLLLTAFYLVPVIISLVLLPRPEGVVLLLTHLFIVILFWSVGSSVDPADPPAITRYYMFLWSLFYVEYILLGLSSILYTGISISI